MGKKTDAWEGAELHACEWQMCQECIYCGAVHRASPVHLWALPATAAEFASQITETDSAAGRERKKETRPTSVCSVYRFPFACMDFSFEFHLSLIFSPPPLRIVCYFLGVFGSQWYESGGFGPPQTTHYRTGIPLHSAEASLKHLQLCLGGGL